jgi:RNA 3'-terminal phosphate cyclase (ATP)
MAMIEIDGSFGEGGGQILRTSLSLSCLTGKPFRIYNIRAGRSNPGLRPQHLKSVEAAAAISQAEVEGARVGSTELIFRPRAIRAGNYRFDIGTAGATGLVIQTVLYPLSLAEGTSRVTVTGGTHVPWAPCYHYLELQWLPFLRRLGFNAEIQMRRAGFYPTGGGEVEVEIRPARQVQPLVLLDRGPLVRLKGISAFANLKRSVAERQQRQAERRLSSAGYAPEIRIIELRARNPNTVMLLFAEYEQSSACYYSLGARGKPAERVADEAVDAFLSFERTAGVFDEYLADQILLPLSLAPGQSRYRTPVVTQHLLTNWAVVQKFLPVKGEIVGEEGKEGEVKVNQ